MKKQKEIVLTIQNEEQFLQYYDEQNQKLVGKQYCIQLFNKIKVLDLHPSWSGACELMNPTFKSLATNVDDFEKRIDLISMDVEKLENYKNDKFSCTCKPKYLLIFKGKIIGEVDGPNAPLLLDKIMKNIPL